MIRTIARGSRAAGLLAVASLAVACAPEAASETTENDAAMADASTPAHGTMVSDAPTATGASPTAVAPTVMVYKSPTCGCCADWVEHLRAAGFTVEVEDTDRLPTIKAEAGVPPQLQSCHTARIGDYVVEGHVPAEVIERFLAEAPDARGLAVPGMPVGSPGMEMGDRVDPYDVVMFDAAGGTSVYESRR